ncbi:MAG: Phosphoribosyltransferase [Candidatus Roizmanbacteria bacterium GW2011_GWA2_37_7]|uniref:Phosphoribosyltransferase n=1 Tax=Candidatus Roizmanbacteria bacterium GW2011_GWA2_37_7 TaxID=1618481 RepID=A0A0G0JJ03_9BACT|nr:MAG: Phosphoribosyltransferase [Candidatus Roizmanbacteria bacterium GW2011_GWA2_37_7]
MLPIHYHKLSWNQFYRDCIELYKNKVKGTQIDIIVSITRGGNIVSRIYSDLLGMIPISNITMTSYKNMKKLKKPVITEEPTRDFKGKTLLIVDEVSDTGDTFKVAIDYFKKKKTKKIFTLSPYIKSHTKFTPDFWQKNIDVWIIFPHDIRETADGFEKMFGKKNAREKMLELGFEDWEVDSVF